MAQQALGPGTAVPRRRALFGLLDADGWALGLGQGVRLADHHHLHARLPARPRLLPDGRPDGRPRRPRLVADQPLPADERDPALPGAGRRAHPVGAVAARADPARSRGPTARPSRSGTQILYIGGTDGTTAQSTGLRRPDGRRPATSTSGPRARRCPSRAPTRASSTSPAASTSSVARDATGAPTDTVFVLSPERPDRRPRRVDHRRRPHAARGRAPAPRRRSRRRPAARRRPRTRPVPSRRPGRRCSTPRASSARGPRSSRWSRPQTDATAVLVGDYLWLYGGSDANGPVGAVQRGAFGQRGRRGPARQPERRASSSAGTSTTRPTCRSPGPTRRAGAPTARSTSPAATTAAARRPRSTGRSRRTTGDLPEWKHLDASDLPASGLEGAAGRDQRPERDPRRRESPLRTPILASSVRANTAPLSPFFQLGLVGATVPGLKIEGEIGQQLGYLNAAGVGHGQLHHPDPHRLGVRPQGADPGAHRARPPSRPRGNLGCPRGQEAAARPRVSPPAGLPRPARAARAGPAARPAPRHPSRRPR